MCWPCDFELVMLCVTPFFPPPMVSVFHHVFAKSTCRFADVEIFSSKSRVVGRFYQLESFFMKVSQRCHFWSIAIFVGAEASNFEFRAF